MRRLVGVLVPVLVATVASVACTSDGATSDPAALGGSASSGPTVPAGFEVAELVSGLEGPTQIQLLDDGRLLVAQLAGGEGEGVGEVLAVDPTTGEREVLFSGLRTPTGVAAIGDEVWVMERRRLSRGPISGGELETVVDELPFNGRSQGTLTPLDDGRLLYNTSGDLDGADVVDGSGTLWLLDPESAPTSGELPPGRPVATGFKHAYARTVDADEAIWQTEVVDGLFDGGQAPDELVLVPAVALDGAVDVGTPDAGWPRCIGDGTPVTEFGGTADSCEQTLSPHAVFDEGATPTSVVVSPWDAEHLLVTMWNQGEVVAVPRSGPTPVDVEPFLTGIEHPQSLLAAGDRLLVVDFDGGEILEVRRASD
jgi:glucose/arabinose dehydrogenase